MPVMLYANGANQRKYPVTAFEDMVTAREQIASLESPVSVKGNTVVVNYDEIQDLHDVANEMWENCYFVGDPPLSYQLVETDNELGILSFSND